MGFVHLHLEHSAPGVALDAARSSFLGLGGRRDKGGVQGSNEDKDRSRSHDDHRWLERSSDATHSGVSCLRMQAVDAEAPLGYARRPMLVDDRVRRGGPLSGRIRSLGSSQDWAR